MQKNGRTLREDLALIRRGLKEFEAMLAGQMKHIYRRNFLKMCCFYLPIWLSAAVIEELLAGKNRQIVWIDNRHCFNYIYINTLQKCRGSKSRSWVQLFVLCA